jgi:atypical dual specificity phosphatase
MKSCDDSLHKGEGTNKMTPHLSTKGKRAIGPLPCYAQGVSIKRSQGVAYRFTWILPNLLAGMACPGQFADLGLDLAYLAKQGIRHIVTLTEDPLPLPHNSFFTAHHFPIRDFGAPQVSQVESFCEIVDEAERRHEGVMVHCLAGIGRTGTFLAAYLMWRSGWLAPAAIAFLREIRPEYVQSRSQEEFLEQWEAHAQAAYEAHKTKFRP